MRHTRPATWMHSLAARLRACCKRQNLLKCGHKCIISPREYLISTRSIRLAFLRHQSCTSSSSHPVELATTSSTQGAGRAASAGSLASSLLTVLVRAKKGGKLVENRFKAPVASRWASRVLRPISLITDHACSNLWTAVPRNNHHNQLSRGGARAKALRIKARLRRSLAWHCAHTGCAEQGLHGNIRVSGKAGRCQADAAKGSRHIMP